MMTKAKKNKIKDSLIRNMKILKSLSSSLLLSLLLLKLKRGSKLLAITIHQDLVLKWTFIFVVYCIYLYCSI